MSGSNTGHALVVGESMAGLLSARVLADHYQRVTLIERDAFPAIGEHRKGVPHGRHVHGLHPRGREILDELFPGFTDALAAAGGVRCDALADLRFQIWGRQLVQAPIGLPALFASRPFLEGHIRELVLAGGLEYLGTWRREWEVPTPGALCQARQRLGPEVMRELYQRVSVPCAMRSTKGAWLAGRRLMAIDGFGLEAPDSEDDDGLGDVGVVGGRPGAGGVQELEQRDRQLTRGQRPQRHGGLVGPGPHVGGAGGAQEPGGAGGLGPGVGSALAVQSPILCTVHARGQVQRYDQHDG